jgi:hypothetical protein
VTPIAGGIAGSEVAIHTFNAAAASSGHFDIMGSLFTALAGASLGAAVGLLTGWGARRGNEAGMLVATLVGIAGIAGIIFQTFQIAQYRGSGYSTCGSCLL